MGERPLWRDRVLAGMGAAAVLVLGWCAVGGGSARALVLVCWTVMPALDGLLLVLSARVTRMPGLTAPARRFWRAMTLAAGLFAIGDATQLAVTLGDPDVDRLVPTPVQSGTSLVGATLLVVLCLTYPTGPRSRRARLRMMLDAAVLNTAATTVAWYLITRPSLATAGPNEYLTSVFGCGLLLVGVFVVVRTGFLGSGPMVAAAALPIILAAGVQGLANAVVPSDTDGSRLALHVVLLLAPCFAAVLSPRIQVLRGGRRPATRTPRRPGRRYSLLPYAATVVSAATLVLALALALGGLGLQSWGVLAGLLVVIALVVARQIVALAENAGLLDRLDESLLEIRRREQRLELLLRHSSDITSIADPDGMLRYLSPASERVLGRTPAELTDRSVFDLLHPDDRARLLPALPALARPGEAGTFQARFRRADGTWRWLEVIAVNLTDEPGIGGVVANARDVTEARELQERLRHQAEHDELTGLPNRRRLAGRMRSAGAGDVTVLLIDLNGFKQLNDTYGHAAGDAVLVHVADRLRAGTRPGDLPARLGGDEFAVLLADTDDPAAAAERIRRALAGPAPFGDGELPVSASVGVAVGPAADPDALLHAADQDMYAEKLTARARTS